MAAGLWLPLALLFAIPQDPRGVALAIAAIIISPTIGWLLALQATNSTGLGFRTAFLFCRRGGGLRSVCLGTHVCNPGRS
jgi:hypothetical protein